MVRPKTIQNRRKKKGSQIIARRASDGHRIARNSSFFKPFSEAESQLEELASTDDDLTPDAEDMDPDADAANEPPIDDAGPLEPAVRDDHTQTQRQSRYGRVLKEPYWQKDYVV